MATKWLLIKLVKLPENLKIYINEYTIDDLRTSSIKSQTKF